MGIKVNRRDVIWNYIGTIMNMGSNFLILPFMLFYLRGNEIGLWYVFLSVGNIVSLIDFGFAPTLARNIAYCWSGATDLRKIGATHVGEREPNMELLSRVIATNKMIYRIISTICLVILLTAGSYYILYVSRGMNVWSDIISWGIYSAAVFYNLYYGYYITLLRGVGAISYSNIGIVTSSIFQIFISIVLLHCGFGLIGVATAYLANGLIFRLVSKSLFYKYENIGARLQVTKLETKNTDIRETFQLVWHNAWRDGLVSFSKYLTTQASTIVCSLFLDLTATGIYALSVQMVTAVASIAVNSYGAYQPSLQAAFINNDINKSKRLMANIMTVYSMLYVLGIAALLTIGIPIISWLKPGKEISVPILVAIAIYTYLYNHHALYASYISNTNRVPYAFAFTVSGFLGVLFAFVLIRTTTLGIWGLVIAQIFVQLIYNNWRWPYIVMRDLKTNPVDMIKISINEFKLLIETRKNRMI